jgi:exosortase
MIPVFAALIAVLYAGQLKGLASEWTSSPDASYGAALACVAIVVAWRRRSALARATNPESPSLPGIAWLLFGVFLYLAGSLGADLFITRSSMIVVLAGLLWYLAGGAAVRVMAAPLLFLLLAIPLPALVVNAVTMPLQLLASRIAESLLATGGVPVYRDGNVLQLPSTMLQVADACSGLRSLISLGALGVLLAWTTPSSTAKRFTIIAAAVPIAIVMNGIRIAVTGVACETWGREMASGGWHTFTGWVTFVVSLWLLVQSAHAIVRLRTIARVWTPRTVRA